MLICCALITIKFMIQRLIVLLENKVIGVYQMLRRNWPFHELNSNFRAKVPSDIADAITKCKYPLIYSNKLTEQTGEDPPQLACFNEMQFFISLQLFFILSFFFFLFIVLFVLGGQEQHRGKSSSFLLRKTMATRLFLFHKIIVQMLQSTSLPVQQMHSNTCNIHPLQMHSLLPAG